MSQPPSGPPFKPFSTPQKPSLRTPLDDTPYSKGSGSHSSYRQHSTQDDYQPYLREDLSNLTFISFDQFLHTFLSIPVDFLPKYGLSMAKHFCKDHSYMPYIRKYAKAVTHENQRYIPFVELVNHVMPICCGKNNVVSCRNDAIIVRGSVAQRKPDVVFMPPSATTLGKRGGVSKMPNGPEAEPFHWVELWGFVEHKQEVKTQLSFADVCPTNNTLVPRMVISQNNTGSTADQLTALELDSLLQCASYALELLSHGGWRRYVLGALVSSDTVRLLYFDRSIIVVSKSIHFLKDHFRFFAMLRGFGTLDISGWGFEMFLQPPNGVPSSAPGSTVTSPQQRVSQYMFQNYTLVLDGFRFTLNKTVHQQHCLIGRGTLVVTAKLDRGSPTTDALNRSTIMIIKISWPPISRTSEQQLIRHATSLAQHQHRWVNSHLPAILLAKDILNDADGLQHRLWKFFGNAYEVRLMRIVVQEKLMPITQLSTADDLRGALIGIFRCYQWLYEVPHILHRDISLNNLMYRLQDGEIYGVLNDFDLAIYWDQHRVPSKQRTGTKPYMAIDLLDATPGPHLYRHDLESLFYVIIWIVCRYHDGKELANPPLQEWAHLGGQQLQDRKTKFVIVERMPRPTPNFTALVDLLDEMQGALSEGHKAQSNYLRALDRARRKGQHIPPFDFDTLDGNVSFSVFRNIFEILG